MTRTYNFRTLFIFLFLALVVAAPVYGLQVGISTNGVGMSEKAKLDDSTSFNGASVLSGGNIFHDWEATGSGNNYIQGSISGAGYSVSNTVASSGSLQTSASTAANAYSSITSQNTRVAGDAGFMASDAISNENEMYVAAGSLGSGGDLNINLVSSAGERASIDGVANIAGVEALNNELSKKVASGDLTMSLEGIYKAGTDGIGNFGLTVANEGKSPGSGSGGSSGRSYGLTGYRWNQNSLNPQIQLYLRSDNLVAEGLNINTVDTAITNAANAWDSKTSKRLFSSTPVINSNAYKWDTYDGKNVLAWEPISSTNTIAYTRTWYGSPTIGGFQTAYESDAVYNTHFAWSTTGSYPSPIDVRTIACHELGHTLGLSDLYNSAYQTQMMYGYYTGPKTLGSGDIAGIQNLYGI